LPLRNTAPLAASQGMFTGIASLIDLDQSGGNTKSREE
jgi:hypothetical protein